MLTLLLACAAPDHAQGNLDPVFEEASAEFEVPRDLLVATSYALTRLEPRDGEMSKEGGVGVMDLRVDGGSPSIHKAAGLLGLPSEELELDQVENIRGAAALLDQMRDTRELAISSRIETLQDWYPVVAQFSGEDDPLLAEGFAAQVYTHLSWGVAVETSAGETITVPAQQFAWFQDRNLFKNSSLVSAFVPASSSNYTNASRSSIETIVIHTVQGSYSGCISWFQNSAASASAHYVVRSSDGEITQMVDEQDVAWHAGHWDTNQNSIGIEHEGYVDQPETWYTEAMYSGSAALVRDIADRYGVPLDRSHIIGHLEVPGCSSSGGGGSSCHTDPGSGWDWNHFMDLVASGGSGGSTKLPASSMADGEKTGRFEAVVESDRYGLTKTCTGEIKGVSSSGHVYLTGVCHLEHEGREGDFNVTWSGEAVGSDLDGRIVVDAYSDAFAGTVSSDGSAVADMTGEHDLGGDIGVIRYQATIRVDP
jgi:N-acetyl-anhydromuramyl-L-alanine amidase AmpD